MSSNEPARADDAAASATSLVSDLGERARREGVRMEHDTSFLAASLRAEVPILYGVVMDGKRIIRDMREPEPGFLNAWVTRHGPHCAALKD